jgi:hypothetical protein
MGILKTTGIVFALVSGMQLSHAMDVPKDTVGASGFWGLMDTLIQGVENKFDEIGQDMGRIVKKVETKYDIYCQNPEEQKEKAHKNYEVNKHFLYDVRPILVKYLGNDPRTFMSLYLTSKIFHEPLLDIECINFEEKNYPKFDVMQGNFLSYCTNIQRINLNGYDVAYTMFNALSADLLEGRFIFWDIFQLKNLTHLDLSYCNFRTFSTFLLFEELGKNTKLTHLIMRGVSIENKWNNCEPMQFRDLSNVFINGNYDIRGRPAELVSYIPKSVCYLDLSENYCKNPVLDYHLQSYLIELKLRYNQLSAESKPENFCSNTFIGFSTCGYGNFDFMMNLAQLIGYKAITHLDFSYNNITRDFGGIISDLLKKFETLETLDLTGNDIEESQIEIWRNSSVNSKFQILF